MTPNDWFFDGHFKNDPCMPGTLMLDGGMQAMEFYLAALGFTLGRDGWRFEPVPGEQCRVRCRREVSPASRAIGYEIFVSGLSSGPYPTLYADILGTVDGVRAFHARRAAVRLVPDWPLDHWRQLGPPRVQPTGELLPLPALGGLVALGPAATGRNGAGRAGTGRPALPRTPSRKSTASGRTTRPCWRAPGDGRRRRSAPPTPASTARACCRACPARPTTS